jgi:hypothetical protein
VYRATEQVTTTTFADPPYVWPVNPWTGSPMSRSTAAGDLSSTQVDGGSGYTLRVMLTGGWSSPALEPLSPV